jgi:prephenate dehydrogenase
MKINTLCIVGVGLIGGSIGLAARQRGLVGRVIGVGRQPAGLEQAQQMGAIDEGSLDLTAAARQAELTVFCTPVDAIAGQVLATAAYCRRGSLLTDAGSTKAGIVGAVEGRLPPGVAFVGGHPLAGSEKRGPQFADANLFQDRVTVLTRTARTDGQALEAITQFWRSLGSRVRVMEPEAHDKSLALTSHLPHLVASVLAGILPPELHDLTATGFKDTTRIAAGDASLWTGIFAQNRDAVLDALQLFAARLAKYRHALEAGDAPALDRLWAQAKRVRDALGN